MCDLTETAVSEERQDLDWLDDFLATPTMQERSTDFCGKIFASTTLSGKIERTIFRCHQHRDCEYCFGQRKLEFQMRLEYSKIDDLVVIGCTEKEAKRLLRSRKTVASDYIRTPVEDDNALIVISNALVNLVPSFDYLYMVPLKNELGAISDEILTSLAELPTGKKASGNLGKDTSPEKEKEVNEEQIPQDDDDIFMFEFPKYTIKSVDGSLVDKLFGEAMIVTSDNTTPETAVEVEEILTKRFKDFEKRLWKKGLSYMVIRRSEKTVSLQYMIKHLAFKVKEEEKPVESVHLSDNKNIKRTKRTRKPILTGDEWVAQFMKWVEKQDEGKTFPGKPHFPD